jgi:hypothetical protein
MTEPSKIRTRLVRPAIMAVAAAMLLFLLFGLVIWQPTWLLPHVLELYSLSGDKITVGQARVRLSPLRVEADQVAIKPDAGMEIELSHLVAEPDLLAWWRGEAWLNLLEVEGLRLSLPQKPAGDSEALDLSLLQYLLVTRDIRVTQAALNLALGEYLVEVASLALSITPESDGQRTMNLSGSFQVRGPDRQSVLRGQLRGLGRIDPPMGLTCQVDLQDAQADLPWVRGPLQCQSFIRLDRNTLTLSRLELTVPPGSFRPFPDIDTSPLDLAVLAAAEISLPDNAWYLWIESLTMGNFLETQGYLDGHGPDVVNGSLSGTVTEAAGLLEILKASLPEVPRDLTIQGPLPFQMSMREQAGHKNLEITLTPEKIQVETSGLKAGLTGPVEINGPVAGPWTLGGRLLLAGAYTNGLYHFASFTLTAPLSGYLTAPGLDGWVLQVEENLALYKNRPLPLGAVTARGDLMTTDGQPALDNVTVESTVLGPMTGSGRLTENGVRADFIGARLDMAVVSSLIGVLTGFPIKEWQIKGQTGLQVTLSPGQTGQEISIQADLANLGFQNAEATIMGQKINGEALFQTAFGPDAPLKLDLRLQQGEALWDTVYLQFKQNPLRMTAQGIPTTPGGWQDIRLHGTFGKMGTIQAFGSARPAGSGWTWQGRGQLNHADLKPTFDTFVRQPLAASYPSVETMVVSGQAELKFTFSGRTSSTSVKGELRLDKVIVSQGEQPPFLENTNLALPFSYVFGSPARAEPNQDQAVETGRLDIQKLRLGQVNLGPWQIPIRLAANRLHLDTDIRLPAWGGTATLSGLVVDQPLSPDFIAHFGLNLDRLDLSQLPLGRVKLEGSLAAQAAQATVTANLLQVRGSLSGQAFDGALELANLSVLHPFGSNRELRLDLMAEQVNLEKLSQALQMGRITGLVNMNLTGLSVAHNLPVAFHLLLKSVPEPREDRTVSLQAVNSISVVGTGAGLTGVGISVFKGFFENLPYREIGIECILKNDVFTVRGLIHEDGVEYLVKRPPFRGVNVVNGDPDNRIGFSEMLNRIQRVADKPSP